VTAQVQLCDTACGAQRWVQAGRRVCRCVCEQGRRERRWFTSNRLAANACVRRRVVKSLLLQCALARANANSSQDTSSSRPPPAVLRPLWRQVAVKAHTSSCRLCMPASSNRHPENRERPTQRAHTPRHIRRTAQASRHSLCSWLQVPPSCVCSCKGIGTTLLQHLHTHCVCRLWHSLHQPGPALQHTHTHTHTHTHRQAHALHA
jgi:hypothetical protein